MAESLEFEVQDHRHGRTTVALATVAGLAVVSITLRFRATSITTTLLPEQVRDLTDWTVAELGDIGYGQIYSAPSVTMVGTALTLTRKSEVDITFDLALTQWRPDASNPRLHRELALSPWRSRQLVDWLQRVAP